MKTAKLLLSVLLAGIIIAAGCVGNNPNPTPESPAQTAPTGDSVSIDTSSIDQNINEINVEQSELEGDISDTDLDLGI